MSGAPVCSSCKASEARQRGSRQARGYGKQYERNRKILVASAWANGDPCWLCGMPFASRADITADHVRPLARGGTSDLANLAPAHRSCNSARGDGRGRAA